MAYWGVGRLGAHQKVAFTGAAGTSAAVGTQTYKVRVVLTAAGYINIGTGAATSSSPYMPADSPEYFTITPGQTVSAIQASSGGDLHLTEIS